MTVAIINHPNHSHHVTFSKWGPPAMYHYSTSCGILNDMQCLIDPMSSPCTCVWLFTGCWWGLPKFKSILQHLFFCILYRCNTQVTIIHSVPNRLKPMQNIYTVEDVHALAAWIGCILTTCTLWACTFLKLNIQHNPIPWLLCLQFGIYLHKLSLDQQDLFFFFLNCFWFPLRTVGLAYPLQVHVLCQYKKGGNSLLTLSCRFQWLL